MRSLILGLCCLTLSLSGQDKPVVLSTASMIHDMAKNIGGDHFAYDMIVPIGGDPHIYDPTPRDAQRCHAAQIILRNGLTFEGWLDALIDNSGTSARVVTVTEDIVAIRSEKYANATDPHAWMDASNGVIYAQNIRDALIAYMPEAEEEIQERYMAYRAAILETDKYITQTIGKIPENRRILITSHDAFQYFGRRYGLQLEAILGISTDADVQTSDIRRLNEVIQSSGVPAVFIESTINPAMLRQIAHDNGISIGGKLFADSLSDEDGPASTYLEMLRYNAETIAEGLSQGQAVSKPSGSENFTWLWLLLLAPVALAVILFLIRMIRQG